MSKSMLPSPVGSWVKLPTDVPFMRNVISERPTGKLNECATAQKTYTATPGKICMSPHVLRDPKVET